MSLLAALLRGIAADAAARPGRLGPALASVLFLADAAAAALLAATISLYLSARKRPARVRRAGPVGPLPPGLARRGADRAWRGARVWAVIGTGLAAAALALCAVPEFITTPSAPPLSYVPAIGPLAALLGTAVGLLVLVAVIISVTIVRGVRMDQLREAPA